MCDTVHLEDNMAEKTNVSLVFDTSDLPETMRNPQTQALIENMSKRASYSRNPAYQGDPRFRFFTEFEPGIYSARPEDSKYRGLSRLFDEWWGSLDDSSRKEFDRRLNVKESYPDFWNGMFDILNGEIAPDDFERFRLLDWYDSIWNEKNERPRRMVPSERKKYNKEHGIWFEY